MRALPHPILALLASGLSATLLAVWPEGRYAGLVAAASMFAVAFAAAWASRATPARAVGAGLLAGLVLAPLPLAITAGLALYRLTCGPRPANDNRASHWADGITFAP